MTSLEKQVHIQRHMGQLDLNDSDVDKPVLRVSPTLGPAIPILQVITVGCSGPPCECRRLAHVKRRAVH